MRGWVHPLIITGWPLTRRGIDGGANAPGTGKMSVKVVVWEAAGRRTFFCVSYPGDGARQVLMSGRLNRKVHDNRGCRSAYDTFTAHR